MSTVPARPPRFRSPLAFLRDPLRALAEAARTGDVPRVRLGPARVRLLVHPETVREVLVTRQRDFRGLAFEAVRRIAGDGVLQVQGEAHLRQRRVLQPAFHRERLTRYGDVMMAHAQRWTASRGDGEIISLRESMVALTLSIVGEALFGDADAAAVDDVRAYLDAGLSLTARSRCRSRVGSSTCRFPLHDGSSHSDAGSMRGSPTCWRIAPARRACEGWCATIS